MRYGTTRVARCALLFALVCAAFGALAASAMAGGGNRIYTANVSPATAQAGSSTPFDFALTNTPSSGTILGSAALTPPLGFRVTGVSLPTGSRGHAYVLFNIVVLDGLNLSPGSTLHVAVTAVAPPRCNSRFSQWFVVADAGGLFGPLLRLDAANSSLTTQVNCAPPASALQFTGQPNNALVKDAITRNSYDTSGPPVTVDLVDSGGNAVNTSGVPVTIALGNNPDSATLGGTRTENTVNGVATFSDLTLDQPDNGFTLVASSGTLTSATSNAFDTSTGETDCNTTEDCLLSLNGSASTLAIDAGPNGGQLSGQVDPGTPMDGPGSSPTADPGCAGYTPQNLDWYGFNLTSSSDSGPAGKTLTGTFKNATPEGFKVCFGSTSEFLALNSDSRPTTAPAGTLPDGTSGFVGFLPFCDQLDSETEPCITDDPLTTQEDGNSTTGEDVIVNVSIPAGFAGDPYFGRG